MILPAPQMAVVVLSFGPRATLPRAVRSLLEQDEPVEIVVIHSGPGDAAALLADAHLDVTVIASAEPLLPGAARNRGIAATRAPFVAFLADDCEARSGWVRNRCDAHAAGSLAVASALVGHRQGRPVALAAHLSLYVNRMPLAQPRQALKYGVSYSRSLFEAHGPFREDLRGGEDSEFNLRFGGEDAILWCPDVVTSHAGCESLGLFLSDQSARGRRMVVAREALADGLADAVAADALVRVLRTTKRSLRVVEPRQWPVLAGAVPLMALGAAAYAYGAARQRAAK